ncbi:MAG: TVP38/TMEM64 family protein [Bdellovibrionales bacterium]|nr:TVP38/TMEM64 family protein [Bdellovibrionales bacterium]
MKNSMKLVVAALMVALFSGFFYFDLGRFLNLEFLKEQKDLFLGFYQRSPVTTLAVYSTVYILSTALSLPGATVLTLLGGALFGLVTGTLVVSFTSTIGATLAFLVSRFLLRDWVQSKFSKHLAKINQGVEQEGAFYLFSLRLIPAFPFFIINLVMGLTPMKTMTFFFVSQIGMLAGTMVYVNAGTQLAQLDSLKGILSPSLILSFCLLGLFPLIAKKVMGFLQKKRGGKHG